MTQNPEALGEIKIKNKSSEWYKNTTRELIRH